MKSVSTLEEALGLIRDIPDFPKPGILFKDVTPLLANHQAFHLIARHMAELISPSVTQLVAVESRGFLLAAAIAQYKDAGVILVRKPGKLPGDLHTEKYALEYGTDSLQIQKDLLQRGSKVAIVDDVLATGGTAAAVESLCSALGASVETHVFLIEIEALNGRTKLKSPVKTILPV